MVMVSVLFSFFFLIFSCGEGIKKHPDYIHQNNVREQASMLYSNEQKEKQPAALGHAGKERPPAYQRHFPGPADVETPYGR